MGQQSAKPELDQEIRYRYKGYPDEIELVFANLKNKHRFQKKMPAEKNLQKEFETFASKLIASEDQKKIIYNLPRKYKWRLLNKHEEIMEGKSQKNITKTPLQKLMQRLIDEQSVYAYNNLFNQIEQDRKQNDEIFWKDFKNYKGPQILIDIISNQNMQSRQSGKYDLLIKLFEFIHYMVTSFDQGIDYLKRVPNGIQTIVSCINPYHPMITAYVFDVSSQFLLGNDEDLENVCRGFSEYKLNNSLSSRFQVLIDILKDSPNIVLIRNTVDFLFSFISLPSNKQRAKLIRQEFIELNIENIFEIILTRIKLGKYKIKDCTEQAYLHILKNQIQEFNYFEDGHIDQNNSNLKMMLLSKKNEQEDIIKEESEEAETVDYNSLADKLEELAEEKNEESEEDEEVDRLLLLSCTLNESDTKIFQMHIQGIKNQMQLFLTFNLDDNEKTILDPVDSVFVKPENYEITFESLIEKLKKKAFENDCYDQLTGSLQKLLLLPSDQDKVKKVFINLDKALSKIFASPQGIISEKELNALVENNRDLQSLIKQINQLEESNRIKDSEISGILLQKDDISAKFLDLKSQTKEMENQIQTLLQEINSLKVQIVNTQESSDTPSAPQLGIPPAPIIGGIPPAPILGNVPQAPQIGGIPPAPSIGGIPPAPQLGGIPPAPPIGGIPPAPQFGSIPPPPPIGGIPPAPSFGGIPPVNTYIQTILNYIFMFILGTTYWRYSLCSTIWRHPNSTTNWRYSTCTIIWRRPTCTTNWRYTTSSINRRHPTGTIFWRYSTCTTNWRYSTCKKINKFILFHHFFLYLFLLLKAPSIGGIPPAPSFGGIPPAPSVGGIPPPPPFGGIPQAPSIGGIPPPPPFGGIPAAPTIGGGIPPPPPPFGGIPSAPSIGGVPPPPPPPFGSSPAINLGGGAPMPPPLLMGTQAPMLPSFNMPMMMSQQPLQKQKKKPNVPLKPFMWNTITANNIKNTIWEKLNDEKVELDIKFIEDQFEKPAAPTKLVTGASSQPNGSTSTQDTQAPTKPMIVQKTSLINGDRTKTYEIVLQKLKISSNLISNALVSCDEKILTLNNLQSLNNICPKQEEVDLVTGYIEGGGKPEDLANPEKFIFEVKKVKGFGDRIRGLIFLKTHEEMFLDLEPKVSKLKRGIFYLRDNKLIPEMLEYVLAFGNYLNGESARGGAWGFKFDSLIKISELKMKDNKTTLMMYVIDIFEKKYNPLISLEDEQALNLCEQLPISQLNADLNEIKKNFRFMQKAIQSQTDLPNDNIKSKLERSVDAIEQRINSIDADIKNIDETYKQVAGLYGEKPTDPSEKFAEKFGQLFRKIKKEKADKQNIEEAKKKEEEKKKKEEEKKAKEDLKASTSKVDQKQTKPDLKASISNTSQQKTQVTDQSVSNPQQNLANIMKGMKSQLSQKANQKSENLENVRGTFIGMQNLNSGDVRMSKCYQNVRESMLMTKNKSDMLGLLKEMKQKKQQGIQQTGAEGGDDLQSVISKIGFLNK
ncbi:hypothetical protein ABPG72_010427 [Tetrahymena utriculariae]